MRYTFPSPAMALCVVGWLVGDEITFFQAFLGASR